MINNNDFSDFKPEDKPRVSLFISPNVIKRAKAKGALDGLTLSEVVEQALIEYTNDKRFKESLSASEVTNNITQVIPLAHGQPPMPWINEKDTQIVQSTPGPVVPNSNAIKSGEGKARPGIDAPVR